MNASAPDPAEVARTFSHLPPLDRIEPLQRLIAEATEQLQRAGAEAHAEGATWDQVAERSGHETRSAARRYFVESVDARRARERRSRLDAETRARLNAAEQRAADAAFDSLQIEQNPYE